MGAHHKYGFSVTIAATDRVRAKTLRQFKLDFAKCCLNTIFVETAGKKVDEAQQPFIESNWVIK